MTIAGDDGGDITIAGDDGGETTTAGDDGDDTTTDDGRTPRMGRSFDIPVASSSVTIDLQFDI